jgi:beta-galactosidase/beta-glucuronidase
MPNRIQHLPPLVSLLVVFSLVPVALATSVIPSTPEHVRSLDGTWRFKLEQAGGYPGKVRIGGKPWPIVLPKQLEPFQTLEYREDVAWKGLNVPGNWEMAGFSPATYNQPDNAIGMYRLEFEVPADWKGRVVKLNFDGVQNGAEVYLNGKPVDVDEPSEGKSNYHQGGWDAFQADLTPVVKFGEKNLLAVRVYKNTQAVDLDTGDYFFLGGIHRTVTLFSVPQIHLDDLAVRTTVSQDGNAELRVLLAATEGKGAAASMQLEGQPAVDGKADGDGHIELVQKLQAPRLWSAEHPNLYTLSVDLKDAGGQVIEHVTKRIGIREVSIRKGILMVNNVPVKLTGMCRHDCAAALGTALNDEIWRKDVTMMKAANVNAIRTSHYPYGSGFYDVCDELGMYVMDEEAACWVPTNTDALTPAFQQHARELVRRDKNHPSVIIWAVGNENEKGKNNKLAAEEIRKIDPTRPRLVSWRDAGEGDVEIDDAHYTNPPAIAEAEQQPRRSQYPKTYLENPNDWDMRNGADEGSWEPWAMVIDRVWREVWKDDHIPGSFNWEWVDRAVADKCPTKLYDYFPATGINIVKVKGLCDAFRNPRAGVYDIKMAYAPIMVEPAVKMSGSTATIHVTNRYSFTDLSQLKTHWQLIRIGKEVASGVVALKLAPRSQGDLELSLPEKEISEADGLRVAFDNADGGNVVTYELRLKPEADTAPKLDEADMGSVKFPHLNFVPVTYGSNAIGWRIAIRHPGKLVNITVRSVPGGPGNAAPKDEAALYAMPLSAVSSMDGDVVLSDDPAATVVGHVHTQFSAGDFSYRMEWTKPNEKAPAPTKGKPRQAGNGSTDIQEFGWIFAMPAGDDRFSWHRRGYWSYYPPDHIGRLSGTATPDSAEVDITKLSRPDAFDFDSTKYNCDWAMLAQASGRGIGLTFKPDARHHVRAGTAPNGERRLVVNKYCCPPRDISSGVIPDQYFTLSEGQSSGGHFAVGATGVR